MNMQIAKYIAIIGLIAMSVALIYGFTIGNFSADSAELLNNPWGLVSMVDLYTGFILFSAWIVYRERAFFPSLVWVILIMVLGFFTASLYTLIALYTSGGNWNKFFMGARADEPV